MLENKAQNSSGKQALRSTKFHALTRVTNEGYSCCHIAADISPTSLRSRGYGFQGFLHVLTTRERLP